MAIKKKTQTFQQQGLTAGTIPVMPESALINTEAQKAGLSPNTQLTNGTLNVENITPQAPAPENNPNLFKGVDISKSFSSKDFANPADYEQAKRRIFESTSMQKAQQEQKMMQQQQILQQLGQVGNVSQAELNQLVEQYGLSAKAQRIEGRAGALREAIPSALQTGLTTGGGLAILGSVGTGATAGTLGGPAGIAIGAAAGVVFGLWKGLRQARKSEAKEDVTNAMAEFTQMKTGMTQVATLASAGYINASEAVELYNAHLTRMLQIEAQIKYLQDTNLKDYLSDGSDDLAQVQSYLTNVAPVYAMRIRSALMNPTTKIPYSDIIMQDLQDGTNTQG
jgi:hypothetical protein